LFAVNIKFYSGKNLPFKKQMIKMLFHFIILFKNKKEMLVFLINDTNKK